jgi:hypothetical protein
LAVFVALEPAVDHLLGGADGLQVEDDFGAGVGLAAVVDELVQVPRDEAAGVGWGGLLEGGGELHCSSFKPSQVATVWFDRPLLPGVIGEPF